MLEIQNRTQFDKKVAIPAILGISLVAILFLVWLIYFHESAQKQMAWLEYLPYINASLNGLSAVFLVLGFVAIRNKQTVRHQRMMSLAFVSSALFLVSYIVYHALHGDTLFLGQGLIRPLYFFILITHISLSVITLPLVFFTFYLSLTNRFQMHRKLARWTFPLWLYVSVTGVLIVFLLKVFNSVG